MFLNKIQLLKWVEYSIKSYCFKNRIKSIPAEYGIVPNGKDGKPVRAVFLQYPPTVRVWDHYFDWLVTLSTDKERVRHVYETVLHELYHYRQYLAGIKMNRGERFIILDETEAKEYGLKQSDIMVSELTDSEINPVKNSESNLDSSLYESFHGLPPKTKRKVHYTNPKGTLVRIGEVSRIDYIPGENSKHAKINFYHQAGDIGEKKLKSNWILATDQEGKNFYLLKKDENSSYPIFTDRGIIG
jgi:hypothetical protein